MKRMLAGTIVVAALLSCSDDPRRQPAMEPAERPVEIARADSGLIPIDDSAPAEVTPVEEQPPPVTPRPRVRPRPTPQPTPAPEPAPPAEPAADTTIAEPEPAPRAPDTLRAPAPDVDTAPGVPAASEIPPPARAPDSVGTGRRLPPAAPAPVIPSMEASGTTPNDAVTLPAGTEFHASLVDSIHSRHDSAGRPVTAKVMDNVLGPDGSTLIPAGALVRLTVVRLAPAKSKGAADGTLQLEVNQIARGDDLIDVTAEVHPVPHELRGRGVTGSEAAKVGVGAAAGAIAGRVLGGDTRGAVIGGVVGAAGGAAVASQTADRDVVVKAGTPITFVLTAPLVAGRM
jgi:hypothetical protein